MDKLSPKAIIFDFGSTLVEYPSTTWEEVNSECVEAARQWLIARGKTVPDEASFHGKFQAIRETYRETAARTLIEWTVPQVAARVLKEFQIDSRYSVRPSVFVNRIPTYSTRLLIWPAGRLPNASTSAIDM
ncbi:MAG: hypothetical protein HY770_05150 [Chitinivibrionia bacterium]|nr:hypothetical protein [Chitinivibrionia bacterium]